MKTAISNQRSEEAGPEMSCANCGTKAKQSDSKALFLYSNNKDLAAICGKCLEGALTVKLIVEQTDAGLQFYQFQVIKTKK